MRAARLYISLSIGLAATALMVVACGGGGGASSAPTGPTGSTSGTLGATVRLTATGAVPKEVSINPGEFVRYINEDTRPHQIQTNPHVMHSDCPPNNIAILNPGQQADTAAFTERKGCGYHNHLLPTDQMFWGLVRVGTADGAGPVYSRGW